AGTLSAFLTALQGGALLPLELANPVPAFHTASHDLSLAEPLLLADGRRLTALDLQDAVWEAVSADAGRRPEAYEAEVVASWRDVLDDLRADPSRCADRLDWVAKRGLLDAYASRHGLDWTSPRLAQLDLAWARLDRPGPWDALAGAGRLRTVVTPPEVERAGTEPPSDTRAWTRGRVVALAADRVTGAAWDWLQVRDAHGAERRVDLAEPLGHTRADVGGLADEAALARLLAGAGHDH
ncbi:MAG: proteasome accessory factor PafA2 family protein, partial [Propionibacteriaceae bacterium]|nr:proteasome accessory factor PafA2 family protein [Propionibacteriaceae bacterium]